jgi:Flp pilus assembly protein TadG
MRKSLQAIFPFKPGRERGAVVALVGVLMIVVVALAALTIDVYHLFVVRNELQNAADAGALAGARVLYNDAGTSVNAGTNLEAFNAATANKAISTAGAIDVDVNWTSGTNTGDVQRGHWSFARKQFTPSDSLAAVDLYGVSTTDLDNMDGVNYTADDGSKPVFINAVRVFARRSDTRAASFFARIFGYEDFALSADAVAYRGFAGTIAPNEVDMPIAICKQSIVVDGEYTCNVGRMLNSGSTVSDHNTAGWTNFTQPCATASTSSMQEILQDCATGNPDLITLGSEIGTTGGVVDAIIGQPAQPDIKDCWMSALYDSNGDNIPDASVDTDGDGMPDKLWKVSLPVIDCPDNNISPCSDVLGSVTVNIVWILEAENKINADAPYKMEGWSSTDPDGINRWNSFVDYFDLQVLTDINTYEPATYENDGFKKKSVYFLPDCDPHEPAGITGGENFGVLAKIPVLVK